MKIDEAIKHAEEVAEKNERRAESVRNRPISSADFYHEEESCSKSAAEHRQLAEWLKDYKRLKEQAPCDDAISREAVMHILDEVGGDFDSPREAVVPIDYIADMVSELPSVSPQPCDDCISRQAVLDLVADYDLSMGQVVKGIHALPSVTPQTKPNIKALGEDIRICQKSITDKKVLIGFNMAVALCNKHLSESEVQDADSD